jgi:photosystem II stability/assembly factor-like uncharacterized protein
MRTAAVALLGVGLLRAQPPAKIEAHCTPEQIDELGLSCTAEQPCPIYLELTSAEAATGSLFVAGNLHTSSATLSSILLASGDGGKTWSEPHPRIPSAVLDQIQFVDLQNGWIGGHIMQNLPRDPFLLATADGGKSWKRKPVSEESRTGALEGFWFESRDSGTLIVDLIRPNETGARRERYSTMTGGDSWTLEEVSAGPLRLKRAPPRDPVWRVRADAKSRVLVLEKNLGNGEWETTAEFPIEVGTCGRE